jgi:DNA-binding MarR family transcriptional regulator
VTETAPNGVELARGDHVDRVTELWAGIEPSIDMFPLHMGARLLRVAKRLEESIEGSLRPLGLSFADFDVLNTIRREGGADGVPPKHLAEFALVTSGAMTARLDRLQRAGLIERHPDPHDRRALRVVLTTRGAELSEDGLSSVLAAYAEFLRDVPRDTQEAIGDALRQLLLEHDIHPAAKSWTRRPRS